MEIYLTRNVRIVDEGAGYAVQFRAAGKADAWNIEGHYGRIEHAAKGAVERAVQDESARVNARMLVEALRRAEEIVARYAKAAEASLPRKAPDFALRGALKTAREGNRNDGAVGESVHLVCEALEQRLPPEKATDKAFPPVVTELTK